MLQTPATLKMIQDLRQGIVPVGKAVEAINATNATKATQDSDGNDIIDTYATKEELKETYKVGESYSSGYARILTCTVKKVWQTTAVRLFFLDPNVVNYPEKPCTVVLYCKTTDSKVDVFLNVESGLSEYPAQLYASYNPDFTGQEATVEVYYKIQGQNSGVAFRIDATVNREVNGSTLWKVADFANVQDYTPEFRLLSNSLHWAWYNQTYSGMTVGSSNETDKIFPYILNEGDDLNDMIPPSGRVRTYRCGGASIANSILNTPVVNLGQTFYMVACTTWTEGAEYVRCIQTLYANNGEIYNRTIDFTSSGSSSSWRAWQKIARYESDGDFKTTGILYEGSQRVWSNNNRPTAQGYTLGSSCFNQTDTVVEYYRSNTFWYRKWASDWKECGGTTTQGGDLSVTFGQNFRFVSMNYMVSFSYENTTDSSTLNIKNMSAWNKSISGFSYRASSSAVNRTWKAEGY